MPASGIFSWRGAKGRGKFFQKSRIISVIPLATERKIRYNCWDNSFTIAICGHFCFFLQKEAGEGTQNKGNTKEKSREGDMP